MVTMDILELLATRTRNRTSKYDEFVNICLDSSEGVVRLAGSYAQIISIYSGLRKHIERHNRGVVTFKRIDPTNPKVHYIYLIKQEVYKVLLEKGE